MKNQIRDCGAWNRSRKGSSGLPENCGPCFHPLSGVPLRADPRALENVTPPNRRRLLLRIQAGHFSPKSAPLAHTTHRLVDGWPCGQQRGHARACRPQPAPPPGACCPLRSAGKGRGWCGRALRIRRKVCTAETEESGCRGRAESAEPPLCGGRAVGAFVGLLPFQGAHITQLRCWPEIVHKSQ